MLTMTSFDKINTSIVIGTGSQGLIKIFGDIPVPVGKNSVRFATSDL